MGGPAICELADSPDIDAIGEDFERSIDDLRTAYSDEHELLQEACRTWIGVLEFFGTPRVWRTADAFARRLITEGTLQSFPDDCKSSGNSPIPGLEENLAIALGGQHGWLENYVTEGHLAANG